MSDLISKKYFRWIPLIGFAICSTVLGQTSPDRFVQWDKNKDDRLVVSELPERLRVNFPKVDSNQDGFISRDEHDHFVKGNRSGDRQSQMPRAKSFKDINYVTSGHPRQKLDLFIPTLKSGKPFPLIIYIHGGAWKSGDKRAAPVEEFLRSGFAVASVNYRLSQHAKFPAQLEDCRNAVKWLRDQARKYHIDPNQFGAFGSSAGGHLVCLLGTHTETKTEPGPQQLGRPTKPTVANSRVQAVCSWFGPTEFLTMNQQSGADSVIDHDAPNSPESLLIGGALQDNQTLAKIASPLSYVSQDDPPFLIMHGDRDRLVPVEQSRQLHSQLVNAGVDCKLIVVQGAGHGLNREEHLPTVIRFFQERLQLKK